ncbi:MAG: PEF-CTERM sorting domain-containing protein [Bacteroidia bacterium]|nr:MAG: PEF-CTERM sorting domain-containing protein [Bacteroidia bacterium]
MTFTSTVSVLSTVDEAIEVDIKFFVADAADFANIKEIIIETAQGVQPLVPSSADNPGSNPGQTFYFVPVPKDPPIAAGYGVSYRIGTIRFSGGPSQHGNPEPNPLDFDRDLAEYYVNVPFTINFHDTPRQGFVLYVYAENQLHGADWAHTAYSHDGAYHQIPEFPTIALPIAGILGIMFILQKRRKEE